MTATDRRRTAYHEAAHAASAVLFGRPLSVVSIRPGQRYRGITKYESSWPRFDPAEFEDVPTLLQPLHLRAALERDIVTSLVGPMAGMYSVLTSGYIEPDPCDDFAEKAAAGLSALSPHHRDLIVTEEATETEYQDDETAAWDVSWALTGDVREAAAHLGWLRVVAHNLVTRHAHRIDALAVVLLERTVLDGETAAAIVRDPPATG